MAQNFHQKLAEQLDLLAASCKRYDDGYTHEALRIALALRIIFYTKVDSRTKKVSSTSLLTHLNSETLVQLLSTAEKPKDGQDYFPALTVWQVTVDEVEYLPKLDRARSKRLVSFTNWWCREIVYLNRPANVEVTRKALVLAAANKDGGAHVDAELEPAYEYITKGLGGKMTLHQPDGSSKDLAFRNAHVAALRQMGYEVLNSPDIINLSRIPKRRS